jgi:hypothetical protein
MAALMSDRLTRYRILDAVPAEDRIKRGFHRLGLVLGLPFVALGMLSLPYVIWNGLPLGALVLPALGAAVGGFLISLCNGLGWVISGFFGS